MSFPLKENSLSLQAAWLDKTAVFPTPQGISLDESLFFFFFPFFLGEYDWVSRRLNTLLMVWPPMTTGKKNVFTKCDTKAISYLETEIAL